MESRTKDIEMLDTNIILRIMLGDVPELAKRALKIIERDNKRYFVSEMSTVEAVYVMESQMKISRQRIAWLVLNFLSRDCICNTTGIFDGVFQLYVEHPKLSFVDCYLAVQAAGQGTTPLWTFDRKLANQIDVAKVG